MEGRSELSIEGSSRSSRYALHGVFFSLLFTVLMYCSPLITEYLAEVSGRPEGLVLSIVGFTALLLALGLINTFLAGFIWHIDVESGSHCLHGLVLFVLFMVLNLPQLIAYHMFPGPLTFLVMFLAYLPASGYLALAVASVFVPCTEERFWSEPRTNY